jgi:hypothetical protein
MSSGCLLKCINAHFMPLSCLPTAKHAASAMHPACSACPARLPANLSQVMTKYMPTSVSGYSATGTAHSVASGRISYAFGLSGPAVTADTGGPSWSLDFRWFISLLLA